MSNGNDRDGYPQQTEINQNQDADLEAAQLDAGRPAVAAAPGRLIIILILAVIFIFIVVRSLFFGSTPEAKAPVKPHAEQVAASSKSDKDMLSISPGTLPTPPPPEPLLQNSASSSAPPPPPPPIVAPPAPEVRANATAHDEALKARIKSNMITSSGGGSIKSAISGGKGSGGSGSSKAAMTMSGDANASFADSVSRSSIGDPVQATQVTNLNSTIIQGKFISAVLETAISSELPGNIRAIVSHDTYAENGRSILIPKGSRLLGVYNSSLKRGQGRLFIIWTRVVRPDGVDIAIDSPGIDSLGRDGVAGDVDNRYFEMFSTAILTSTLDIGVAAAGQGLFGNQEQTTTTGGGGTTTTSSPSATAMQEAVQNVGDVGKSIVSGALNLSPIITVDQGTIINVFVNHDLIFPNGHSHFVE